MIEGLFFRTKTSIVTILVNPLVPLFQKQDILVVPNKLNLPVIRFVMSPLKINLPNNFFGLVARYPNQAAYFSRVPLFK